MQEVHPEVVGALQAIIRATTILVTRDMTQLRCFVWKFPKGEGPTPEAQMYRRWVVREEVSA